MTYANVKIYELFNKLFDIYHCKLLNNISKSDENHLSRSQIRNNL